MMSKSKLKKMRMPEKKGEDLEGMEMAESSEEMPPEDEMMEGMSEEEMPEMEEAPMADLEAISDEDLMAEIQKRGLMSQLGEAESTEVDEEDMV